MSIDAEVERPKFEAQWESGGWTRGAFRMYGGRYINSLIEAAYQGWLAAKRDAESKPEKPADANPPQCERSGVCVCVGHFARDRDVCRHWKRSAEQEAKNV